MLAFRAGAYAYTHAVRVHMRVRVWYSGAHGRVRATERGLVRFRARAPVRGAIVRRSLRGVLQDKGDRSLDGA
eukprot:15030445-Alexandrium_andersonii.AAC.1